MAKITLQEEASAPSTPGTGKWHLYLKADGLYIKDDAGNETGPFGIGGGDAKAGINGLQAKNNATTPNTKYDFVADMVALRNPSTGVVVVRTNTGTITCDITLPSSGSTSTANGCDQTKISALTSQWVHFYFIWDGTTLATLASLTAPPTGPTLPSGYTHWAYIGAIRLNGSSQLVPTYMRGGKAYYRARQIAVSAGSATSETSLDISALIPPNALDWHGSIDVIKGTTNGSGAITLTTFVRIYTGENYIVAVMELTGLGATSSTQVTGPSWNAPNIGQAFYYFHSISPGTSPSASIFVLGYTVPNNS